jgi:hypothetical protein
VIVVCRTGLDGLPDKTLLNSGPLHLNLTWGADGMRPHHTPSAPARPWRLRRRRPRLAGRAQGSPRACVARRVFGPARAVYALRACVGG